MSKTLMDTIREITFSDANDADVKRENANIDGNSAMGTMLQYGSAVSKEFCDNYTLEPEHRDSHADGKIHIHDKDFLNMGTLTCCQQDLTKLFKDGFSTGHGYLREPQCIRSYAALAAIAIQANQNDQHGGQSIASFDHDMAEGVLKTYRKLYILNLIKAMDAMLNIKEEYLGKYTQHVIDNLPEITTIKPEDSFVFVRSIFNSLKVLLNDESEEMYHTCMGIESFASKYAYAETNKAVYQAMEGFIHNLNTMHSRAGAQVPFSSVNFGTDKSHEGRMVSKNLLLCIEAGLGHHETAIFPISIFKVKEGVNFNPEDPNYDLFKLSCRVSSKRLFPNFCFLDAPFNLEYYVPGRFETEATYMGCRTRTIGNVCGPEIVTGRGNLSFTSVNLPRLGIKHGKLVNGSVDYKGFFDELEDVMDTAIDQLYKRFKFQGKKKIKNFPFLMGQGNWIDSDKLGPNDTVEDIIRHGTLSVGFIGLAECLKALDGQHHGESEDAQNLGLSIISFMRERLDNASKIYNLNFSLLATPAEGLSGRFINIDKKKFGIIEGVTDKEYYTNSFHIPVYHKISAFNKIKLEAPYHNYTNAGHITYVELDGNARDNVEAFESIIRCMKEEGVGYGSINHPVDRCPICGFNGVIGDECPECRATAEEVNFERIRRITGYLAGTVDRFNDAKRAEVRDRVKHRAHYLPGEPYSKDPKNFSRGVEHAKE